MEIYVLLLLLDFYSSISELTKIIATLSVLGVLAGYLLWFFNIQDYNRFCKNTPEESWDALDHQWAFYCTAGLQIIKFKYWALCALLVATLLPSVKTVYITTGIYVGNSFITQVKESPLAEKAYSLAEQKLQEYLTEDTKKDSSNANK